MPVYEYTALDKAGKNVNGIIDAGVMHTPALAVNGEVVVEGKIPEPDEIKRFLA